MFHDSEKKLDENGRRLGERKQIGRRSKVLYKGQMIKTMGQLTQGPVYVWPLNFQRRHDGGGAQKVRGKGFHGRPENPSKHCNCFSVVEFRSF